MSYILDALRRADAERERDPARGIHAQPAAVLPREASRRQAPWILGGLLVALAMAGAYLLAGSRSESADAPVVRLQPPVQVPAASNPPAAAALVTVADTVLPPPPPAPAVERRPQRPALAAAERSVMKAPAASGVTSPPTVPPTVAPAAPSSAPAAASPTAPSAPPRIPSAAPPTTAPSNPATTGPSTVPSNAAPGGPSVPPARIVAVGELPADIQRELPKLVIAGGVHSENPAQRMLIVGGQVRSEVAELAPGLVLEQIRAGSAVLRFRGWRYSVGY